MAKSACAVPDVFGRVGKRARATRLVRIWLNVKNDVVRVRGTRHSGDRSELVEPQRVARSPSNHVIGAGRVAAYSHAADSDATFIEREAAAEYMMPPTRWPTSGSLVVPKLEPLAGAFPCPPGGVAVGDIGIDRIAGLQPIQAAARLHRRIEVSRGEGDHSASGADA
jgi:hypothetical protein